MIPMNGRYLVHKRHKQAYHKIQYEHSPDVHRKHIDCNAKFIAIHSDNKVAGNDTLSIIRQNQIGQNLDLKLDSISTLVPFGHDISQFSFHPFQQQWIATASTMGSIMIWKLPESSQHSSRYQSKPIIELKDEESCINSIAFHPTADNILGSCSGNTAVVHDIQYGKSVVFRIGGERDRLNRITWNRTGSLFATSSSDGLLTVADPRAANLEYAVRSSRNKTHTTDSPVVWLTSSSVDHILMYGCSNLVHQANFLLYDPRQMAQPSYTYNISTTNTGTPLIHYDEDKELVQTIYRGRPDIQSHSLVPFQPFFKDHTHTEYNIGSQIRDICYVPNFKLKIQKWEALRCLCLLEDSIQPVSFYYPKQFFIGLSYTRTRLPEASQTAQQYFDGKDAEPRMGVATQEDDYEIFLQNSSNKELKVYNKILKEGIYQVLVTSGRFVDCDVYTYS